LTVARHGGRLAGASDGLGLTAARREPAPAWVSPLRASRPAPGLSSTKDSIMEKLLIVLFIAALTVALSLLP